MAIVAKVLPARPTGWQVELASGGQPFQLPTKGQAIHFAVAWAEQHQPCEVHVYGPIGDLERILKFPDGNYRRAERTDRRRMQVPISFPNRRRQERRRQA